MKDEYIFVFYLPTNTTKQTETLAWRYFIKIVKLFMIELIRDSKPSNDFIVNRVRDIKYKQTNKQK